ncbi:MAG TPA: chorismate synthase, partial [Treponemataceae bacterium]|nr:chorismate synthase [Treponemataceae bacterium]
VFDKLDALLARAVLSVGAIKGIEFGAGFAAARMTGSEHNDAMRSGTATAGGAEPGAPLSGKPDFLTNHAGGILGGLSTGADVVFRAAVKPVSSISIQQQTIDTDGRDCDIEVRGRHDVCLCPRIVPVIEAMAALTVLDLLLQQKALR